MHLGRRYIEHFYGAEHTAVRQIFLENLFPLSSIVSLASEFLSIFFGFCILWPGPGTHCAFLFRQHSQGGDAWSHYTRVISPASRLRRGRAYLFYSSLCFLINVVYDGSLFRGRITTEIGLPSLPTSG